jgi:hypothetical protein
VHHPSNDRPPAAEAGDFETLAAVLDSRRYQTGCEKVTDETARRA